MDSTTYVNFCRVLFLFAALFIILLIFLLFLGKIRSIKKEKKIYKDLDSLWNTIKENNTYLSKESERTKKNEDYIIKAINGIKNKATNIMYSEAKRLYQSQIQNNNYLMKKISSPSDLLIKFLSSINENNTELSNIKFNIILELSNYPEKFYKKYKDHKEIISDTFNVFNFIITLIGTIATILSLLPI